MKNTKTLLAICLVVAIGALGGCTSPSEEDNSDTSISSPSISDTTSSSSFPTSSSEESSSREENVNLATDDSIASVDTPVEENEVFVNPQIDTPPPEAIDKSELFEPQDENLSTSKTVCNNTQQLFEDFEALTLTMGTQEELERWNNLISSVNIDKVIIPQQVAWYDASDNLIFKINSTNSWFMVAFADEDIGYIFNASNVSRDTLSELSYNLIEKS